MNSNRDYATENINLKKRLEVLEKENIKLRQEVSALEDYSYDVDCEKELLIKENEKLKNEKEELSQAYDLLNKTLHIVIDCITNATELNQLKIDIMNKISNEVLSK